MDVEEKSKHLLYTLHKKITSNPEEREFELTYIFIKINHILPF